MIQLIVQIFLCNELIKKINLFKIKNKIYTILKRIEQYKNDLK